MRLLPFLLIFNLVSCRFSNNDTAEFESIGNLLEKQDNEHAKKIFNSIKKTKSNDRQYRIVKIIIDFRDGKYANALESSIAFSERYPESPLGFYHQGLSEFNLEKYQAAGTNFDKALDIFNSINGGYSYQKKDVSLYDDVYIFNDLIFMLGVTCNLLNKFKSSIYYLQKVIGKKYKLKESYYVMADSYLKSGDKDNARKYAILAKEAGNLDADDFIKSF